MDTVKILASLKAIEAVLNDYPIGQPNARAVDLINKELATIRSASWRVRYMSEGLREWVDILYSVRKHQKWGGPGAVKDRMITILAGIKSYLTWGSAAKTGEATR